MRQCFGPWDIASNPEIAPLRTGVSPTGCKENAMVYSNRFIMCVLVNGQVQKELSNGVVQLPFDTEYSLRFRNKNNCRAVVQFYIDGENVSNSGYVIPANSFIDIKRHYFIDKAFKFVSLDSTDAQEFGKDGPNPDRIKGVIEARFFLEKEKIQEVNHHHHHHHYIPRDNWIPVQPRYPYSPPNIFCERNPAGTSGLGSGSVLRSGSELNCSLSDGELSLSGIRFRSKSLKSDSIVSTQSLSLKDGCTVEGNSTGQTFGSVHIDLQENCTVLKLFLQGYDPEACKVLDQDKKVVYQRLVNALEEDNKILRQKLAEMENKELKKKIASKVGSKKASKKVPKKAPKKKP